MMNKDSGSLATDANQIRARIEEVRMRRQFEVETLRDTVEPLLQAIREVMEVCPEEGFGISLDLRQDENMRAVLVGKMRVPQFHARISGRVPVEYDVMASVDAKDVPWIAVEAARLGEGRGASGETEQVRHVYWTKTYAKDTSFACRIDELVEHIRDATTVYVTEKDPLPEDGFRI